MKLSATKTKEFQKIPFRAPGRKEFQLLEFLWARSPLTVAEVLAVIPPARALAYTTVMTMLNQLFRKGLLKRIRKGRAFVYWPIFSREEVLAVLLDDFVQSYLGGNMQRLTGLFRTEVTPETDPAIKKKPEPSTPAAGPGPGPSTPVRPADTGVVESAEPDQVEDFML